MVDIDTLSEHEIECPVSSTCLGTPEEFDKLSLEHQDQIRFYDKEGSDFLYRYFHQIGFHTGPLWSPFEKGNFLIEERISLQSPNINLKKWLSRRGIPFSHWVFILPNYGKGPISMTWKLVIKQCENLFWSDDIVIFDRSNQWCLTYWHEDEMIFGRVPKLKFGK